MCRCTAKVVLVLLSALFWVVAAFLFAVGSVVFLQYQNYDELTEAWYTLIPAIILLGVGMLLILIGIVGCVGAFKEQRCLLGLFCTTLLIIFAGLLVSSILAWVYKKPVLDGIDNGMNNLLENYGQNQSLAITHQMDYIQSKLKCCGIHNYTDWKDTWWYKHQDEPKYLYPESCCPGNYTHCSTDKVYQQGCLELVKDMFLGHLVVVAASAAGILALLVLGMVFACVLMCKKREMLPQYSILSNDGMRV